MIKIESTTLEQACKDAALALECSASELAIEIVQVPSKGIMGLFKKSAIIVAAKKTKDKTTNEPQQIQKAPAEIKPTPVAQKERYVEEKVEAKPEPKKEFKQEQKKEFKQEFKPEQKKEYKPKKVTPKQEHHIVNDTIMPQSFVSMQEDDDYDMEDINYTADYDDEDEVSNEKEVIKVSAYQVAKTVEREINELFKSICFNIEKIDVTPYDESTLLIEFKGEDAALLIGKEGYRYKALSYMIFNWINTKYQLQLRLEIAEFLKNQEESVARYLVSVCENIDRDGRAQTKILDGVLIQIALKELREKYPNKYVAVRSTRDGLKFIIINDYHN
ncbi:MAG: Jag N-terminal domain-containing protein [Sulfurimonas sp.]|jgi:spoIIIJ-associated protein